MLIGYMIAILDWWKVLPNDEVIDYCIVRCPYVAFTIVLFYYLFNKARILQSWFFLLCMPSFFILLYHKLRINSSVIQMSFIQRIHRHKFEAQQHYLDLISATLFVNEILSHEILHPRKKEIRSLCNFVNSQKSFQYTVTPSLCSFVFTHPNI